MYQKTEKIYFFFFLGLILFGCRPFDGICFFCCGLAVVLFCCGRRKGSSNGAGFSCRVLIISEITPMMMNGALSNCPILNIMFSSKTSCGFLINSIQKRNPNTMIRNSPKMRKGRGRLSHLRYTKRNTM